MTNKIEADVKTPSGNTGLDSQNGFEPGIDWLDLIVRDIRSGEDATDFLSMLSTVVADELLMPKGKGRFCGEKWKRSGVSPGGIRIDYVPHLLEAYHPADAFPDCQTRLRGLNRLLPSSDEPFSFDYVDSLSRNVVDGFELKAPEKLWCTLGFYSPLLFNNDPLNYGYKWVRTTEERLVKTGKMRISMSGKSCSRIDMLPLLQFLAMSRDTYRIECTRLDAFLDDTKRTIKRENTLAAIDAGNYSGVTVATPYEPRNRGHITGYTHYFGSTKSDTMLRIYDKAFESNGVNLSIRMEMQNRRDKADCVFRTLLALAEHGAAEIPRFIASIVVGCVSFVDRSSGDKNVSRCSLLPWYEQLIKATTEPMKLKVKKEQPTVQKKIMHIAQQVKKSLAIVASIVSTEKVDEFIHSLIGEGIASFTNADKFLIETTKPDELCIERDERKAYQEYLRLAVKQLLPLPAVASLVT